MPLPPFIVVEFLWPSPWRLELLTRPEVGIDELLLLLVTSMWRAQRHHACDPFFRQDRRGCPRPGRTAWLAKGFQALIYLSLYKTAPSLPLMETQNNNPSGFPITLIDFVGATACQNWLAIQKPYSRSTRQTRTRNAWYQSFARLWAWR